MSGSSPTFARPEARFYSMPDEEGGKIRHIDEARHPGEGFPQQELFLRVISDINDESHLLVQVLRCLRMCVGPQMPLSEDQWQVILQTADQILTLEHTRGVHELLGATPAGTAEEARQAAIELRRSLEELGRFGVGFTVDVVNGTAPIEPAQIVEYMADFEGYLARFHGVPLEHFSAWAEHVEETVCAAKTRDGRVCNGRVPRVDHPKNFRLGVSDLCMVHRNRSR